MQGGRRRKRRGGGEETAPTVITKVGEEKGVCPDHIKADLANLPIQSDDGYLRHKRKTDEENSDPDIATHCFMCGIEL